MWVGASEDEIEIIDGAERLEQLVFFLLSFVAYVHIMLAFGMADEVQRGRHDAGGLCAAVEYGELDTDLSKGALQLLIVQIFSPPTRHCVGLCRAI